MSVGLTGDDGRGHGRYEDDFGALLVDPRRLIERGGLPGRLVEHERAPLEVARQIERAVRHRESGAVERDRSSMLVAEEDATERVSGGPLIGLPKDLGGVARVERCVMRHAI